MSASSSIISRAVRRNLKEPQKEVKQEEDYELPPVRDPDDGWRRLYLKVEIAMLSAWHQSVLLALTTLAPPSNHPFFLSRTIGFLQWRGRNSVRCLARALNQ